MNRKLVIFTILALLLSLFAPAVAGAQGGISDGQPAAARYSHRLIVELQSPALAEWAQGGVQIAAAGPAGRLDVASPAAQQYAAQLKAEQSAFVATMTRAVPNAQVASYLNENGQSVPATYQVVFNGMSVDAGRNVDVLALREQLQRLPGVKAVYLDFAHDPDLYASLPLINAQAAWDNVAIGGKSNAGAGVKFASMDGGVHHLSPMFDGTGYSYPAGFPKGDTSNTNGKIILSKVYFRTWDPPSAGDENAWPGVKGTQHGSHTASTVAGGEVQASFAGAPPVTISGVAPKAYVMSYRVFYNSITNDGSFYNTEGIKALEDIVMDGADVLNNSWGGGPGSVGGEYDALDQALINATKAGIFVSMSNGNAGPGLGTGDHPSPDYINVAASQTSGTYASGKFNVTAPEPVPANLQEMSFATASFGQVLKVGQVYGPYSILPAGAVDPTNVIGCKAFPAGAFAGKMALIQRGTCEFGMKVLNAEKAGATFAVIYNSVAGGDALINMGAGVVGAQVTIPAIAIGLNNGLRMVNWYTANGNAAQAALSTVAYQLGSVPDVIASFSSRGPGVGLVLKPDITAPGVNILAQGFDPTVSGEAGNFGYGQVSGTSMAAPHVAGAAALIKQIHPTWSPAWIKSALMSSSKYMDIFTDSAKKVPAQPLDMGAGRLDLTNAADPGVILDPPSLSFGAAQTGTVASLTVMVTSVAAASETYALSTLYTGMGYASTTPVAGMTFEPASLTLAPGETKQITIRWDTAASLGFGDNQGFLLLAGSSHNAHLPAWMRVSYPSILGKVLIIDNDGSSSLGKPDYAPYYAAALDALPVAYDVWDADDYAGSAVTIPDATVLAQYPVIIYETGDNNQKNGTFTVPTPPTTPDMDRLVEYANGGGHVIAFGQDLASITAGSSSSAPFFYSSLLGATYLQDSVSANKVFTNTAQLITGLPGTPFRNASFDISGRGDGAGNLGYVDEIKVGCTDGDCTVYQPLLKYSAGGTFKEDGYVALSHRDQPTLERPGRTFDGSALYYSFGLEGVNSNTGYNSRADLVSASLRWSLDKGYATITPTINPVGRVSYFTAALTADYGGVGTSYRWDFGDGTAFTVGSKSATAGHTYAAPGTYTVRVEAANALGTRVIGAVGITIAPSQPVYVNPVTKTFAAAADTYLAAGQPTTNFGNWAFLYTGADDIVRSVVQFNLGSINVLYPVDKATLSLYVDAFSGGGTGADLKVYGLNKAWAENTATWWTPWVVAGGDFAATATATTPISSASVGQWVQFDVTPLAQQWVANPAANYGALLRVQNPISYTVFRMGSREYWLTDKTPKIEVQYRTP
ncbi:MAG: S8 family serine peptidase [Chloroflexi bacterium]|nr:S8 family serine peptidase [Chloroflexota bacterium]